MRRAAVAWVGALTFVAAAREVAGREAWRRAPDVAAIETARAFTLPDAGLVVLPTEAGVPATLRRGLVDRPRDPRLLAALAAGASDPFDDDALALAVRAVTVAPYAGGVADATSARCLAEGEVRATSAVLWRDRARRAATTGRPDRAELEAEAARALADARRVLDAVLAVDAALSPTTPGRAPVTERAARAARLLADLEERP